MIDDADKKPEPESEPKRSYSTQALGKTISRLTRSTYQKRGFADGEILHRWPTIVGDLLARASHPDKIVYPNSKNNNATLYLRVGNPGLALDIQHMEPMILERINSHFGYRAVARLKLIQAPLTTGHEKAKFQPRPLDTAEVRALEDSLASVEDPDLKKSLRRLGQAVGGRNKT